MKRLAWVVGARGLLGSGVVRAIGRRPSWTLAPAAPLPWGDHAAFAGAARRAITAFLRTAAAEEAHWNLIWAAGATVTSSSTAELEAERSQLRAFFEVLGEELLRRPLPGGLFFASSGGGVYSGSANPPFNEETEPRPLSAYGAFKLDMEADMRSFASASGVPLLIGRITNLYGPGQRLDKMQGLVSHLALSRFAGKPVFIFVPMDTVRDYVFVDDCAALILDGLERLEAEAREARASPAVTKILGSGEEISIASLFGFYRAITKSTPRVVIGTTSSTQQQAPDLRMRSIVWPELDRRERTPFAAGFHATMMDVLQLVQNRSA